MAAETAGRQPLARGFTAPGPHALRPRRKKLPKKRDSVQVNPNTNLVMQNDQSHDHAHRQPPRWAKEVLRAAVQPQLHSPSSEENNTTASDTSHPLVNDPTHVLQSPEKPSLALEAVPDKNRRLRRGDVVRASLKVLRTAYVPLNVLIEHNVMQELVQLINDHHIFASSSDKVIITAAIHSLCSTKELRDAFIAASGLRALCVLVTPMSTAPYKAQDPFANAANLQVVESMEESDESLRSMPERQKKPLVDASSGPRARRRSDDIAFWTASGSASVNRAVWNAVIRTIAKLVVCSVAACACSIESGALRLLARAALPSEHIDIRVRAGAGLAAIAAWSGPRRAVAIVETPYVVKAMSALLTEKDDGISNYLRSAAMDGLVAMSFHRRARRILREHGCDGKIAAAAKHASMSGDYDIAARGTVAAGQLTGRSVDEFGFLVQETGSTEAGNESDEDHPSLMRRRSEHSTSLQQIEQQMLSEAYMQVEEMDALEEIVLEDVDLLGSSARDQQLVHDAARMYGMPGSGEGVISALPLERAGSPTSQAGSSPDPIPRGSKTPSSVDRTPSQSLDNVEHVAHATSGVNENAGDHDVQQKSISGDLKRRSSSNASSGIGRTALSPGADAEDPDDDQDALMLSTVDDSTDESRGQGPPSSRRSRKLSPLLLFSLGTRKAAELDGGNGLLRKSTSQLNREVEYERIWTDVLENHPEMLERGTGSTRRIRAYRELAIVPVPLSLRRKLWPILLGTPRLREMEPDLYSNLCARCENEQLSDDTEHTIEADITRTMPLHSLFWSGGAQVGIKSLRSILRAYALYRPEIGYCQGMSSVAAVFLMNAKDEDDAFLMFIQFMERFQYKRIFAPGFPQMRQWIDELRPLMAHYMPELSNHLARENVMLELYADKWLITALTHNFPHAYLLRIWDLMFLGGSPKIILKACLAVLKSCESRLLTMRFEEMMSLLQRDFKDLLDPKDTEPFLALARDFRFIPNLPKVDQQTSPTLQPAQAVELQDHTQRRADPPQRQGFCGACFCFGRSQTAD